MQLTTPFQPISRKKTVLLLFMSRQYSYCFFCGVFHHEGLSVCRAVLRHGVYRMSATRSSAKNTRQAKQKCKKHREILVKVVEKSLKNPTNSSQLSQAKKCITRPLASVSKFLLRMRAWVTRHLRGNWRNNPSRFCTVRSGIDILPTCRIR